MARIWPLAAILCYNAYLAAAASCCCEESCMKVVACPAPPTPICPQPICPRAICPAPQPCPPPPAPVVCVVPRRCPKPIPPLLLCQKVICPAPLPPCPFPPPCPSLPDPVPCPECAAPPAPPPCPECPPPPAPEPCPTLPPPDPCQPPPPVIVCSPRPRCPPPPRCTSVVCVPSPQPACSEVVELKATHSCGDSGCTLVAAEDSDSEDEEYKRRFLGRRRYYTRRFNRKALRKIRKVKRDTEDEDKKCNDKILKDLMISNMSHNTTESKINIEKATRAEYNGDFNVICSEGTFAYVTHTNTFCEIFSQDITCYAFPAS